MAETDKDIQRHRQGEIEIDADTFRFRSSEINTKRERQGDRKTELMGKGRQTPQDRQIEQTNRELRQSQND